jgi:NADH:ubiquinone oxidoreductase subunit H
MRGVAQSISYEISFALIIIFFILYLPNLRIRFVISSAEYTIKLILCLPIAGL